MYVYGWVSLLSTWNFTALLIGYTAIWSKRKEIHKKKKSKGHNRRQLSEEGRSREKEKEKGKWEGVAGRTREPEKRKGQE